MLYSSGSTLKRVEYFYPFPFSRNFYESRNTVILKRNCPFYFREWNNSIFSRWPNFFHACRKKLPVKIPRCIEERGIGESNTHWTCWRQENEEEEKETTRNLLKLFVWKEAEQGGEKSKRKRNKNIPFLFLKKNNISLEKIDWDWPSRKSDISNQMQR